MPHTPATNLLGAQDLHFFNEGTHVRLYDHLGAHLVTVDGVVGTSFAVWAPNAERVSVMGEFNGWDKESHSLYARDQSGIWERFFPELRQGATYKYHIVSRDHDYQVDKMDPFAFFNEVPPKTASIVFPPQHTMLGFPCTAIKVFENSMLWTLKS